MERGAQELRSTPEAPEFDPVNGQTFFWSPPPWTITDAENHLVEGYASLPNVDDQGEVIPLDVIAAALPSYMEWGNLRADDPELIQNADTRERPPGDMGEMHHPWSVGKVLEAHVDAQGLWIKAQISDAKAWQKVQSGEYQGFSVGGGYPRGSIEYRADGARVITRMLIDEISLVDRPANPQAKIALVKLKRGPATFPVHKLGGPSRTMMHARGMKRAKPIVGQRCSLHGKEDCEACKPEAGTKRTTISPARKKFIGASLRAALQRAGIKTQQPLKKVKNKNTLSLAEALELVTDPEQKEQVTAAFAVLEKAAGAPTDGNWGTKDMTGDLEHEANIGIELEPGENEGDLDVDDFLKAHKAEGEGDGEGDGGETEKASQNTAGQQPSESSGQTDGMSEHFAMCAKHLAACHKAVSGGEEHDVIKGHLVKAMKAFGHLHKCFGKVSKAWTEKAAKVSKAAGRNSIEVENLAKYVHKLDKHVEQLQDWIQSELVEVHKSFQGLPYPTRYRQRPQAEDDMETAVRDADGNPQAAEFNRFRVSLGR